MIVKRVEKHLIKPSGSLLKLFNLPAEEVKVSRKGGRATMERIDRIEKALEEMAERQKNDRIIIERLDKTVERLDKTVERLDKTVERLDKTVERLDKSSERHDKILANLEANQIVIGKAMEGIRVEVGKMAKVLNEFMDVVGYKFREHESRITKLEEK